MTILTFLVSGALPIFVAAGPSDSFPRVDSSTAATRRTDSAAPVVGRPLLPRPVSPWSTDFGIGLGIVAVDFPERARFAAELSNEATFRKWTLDQPFSGSDLGPRIEWEAALRREERFRLALGGWWQGWSAQGIARDTAGVLTYRSYGSDIVVGSVGMDLLISRSILRLDAGHEAFLGARWLIGAGRLQGRTSVWGVANGVSIKGGAEFLRWSRGAIAAHLAVDWLNVASDTPWSDILWNSAVAEKTAWAAGGLSLGIQVRWGAPRDTTRSLQKK